MLIVTMGLLPIRVTIVDVFLAKAEAGEVVVGLLALEAEVVAAHTQPHLGLGVFSPNLALVSQPLVLLV